MKCSVNGFKIHISNGRIQEDCPGLNVEDLTEMKFYLLTVTGQWDYSGTAWDPRDGIFKCGGVSSPALC